MKLIINISKCERTGSLVVSDYIKMSAMPSFTKDGYADTTGMSVRFYNANKELMEEFSLLAEHIKQEVQKFHQAYGEENANTLTTGKSSNSSSSSSLETSNETTDPSTI